MAELISFYSVAPSQGKKTISLSFAHMLAAQDNKVLYVELDLYHPSIANTMQITHPTKNINEYFHNAVMKNTFDLESFILKKQILMQTEERELKKIYSELDEQLDYLIFPNGFNEDGFPTLIDKGDNPEQQAHEFIQKFLYSLKTTKYQYVILNLPNNIESIFGFEVIAGSDAIVNVVTPSASRLYENKVMKNFLTENITDLNDKWFTLMNMTSPAIDDREYIQLVKDVPVIVPFDLERQKSEFSLRPDSEEIRLKMEELAFNMQISIVISQPKKKGFSLFKG